MWMVKRRGPTLEHPLNVPQGRSGGSGQGSAVTPGSPLRAATKKIAFFPERKSLLLPGIETGSFSP
jgi:hypothetical protein